MFRYHPVKYNIDTINEYIEKHTRIPMWDFSSGTRLTVIRSFDVNKPGAEVDELTGGVAGGSTVTTEATTCANISCVASLHTETNFAVPGGLIGVGTKLDSMGAALIGSLSRLSARRGQGLAGFHMCVCFSFMRLG